MTSPKLSGRVPSDTAGPLNGACPAKKQQGILGVVIFLHAIVVICFMEPHTIAAQGKQNATPAPLQVTTQGLLGLDRDCKAGEGLIIQLRYAGEKVLRGYVLSFDSVEHGPGKTSNPEILEEARSLRAPEILDGQEWTRIICSVPTKVLTDPSTLSAKIDVLKFADGSIWGPAALRESHQLIGKLDGMDFIEKETELKRFVSPILPERGPVPTEATESQIIGPLRFDSGIWRDERGQDKLAVQVTNESDSPIRGYLFTTTFFNPENGVTIRRVSTKELETQGDPSRYLAPQQAWVADPRKFSYLPDGSLARYKITLDLVVFADGSIFGPMHSQESAEVLGMVAGIDEADRLRQAPAKTGER
jgi:hypothetical protein